MELPFVGNSVGAKTAPAVWDFYERLGKDELKDVKVLAVWGFGRGALFTKDVVIKSPTDVKGLKLRASNRQTNDAFTLLGAQTAEHSASGRTGSAGQRRARRRRVPV